MIIKVLNPGISTTIQDSGRLNGLAYGVPVCGAMDMNLFHSANALVGNPISFPAFELTLQGGEYEVDADCNVAITGYDNPIEINGVSAVLNTNLPLKKGDRLNIKQSSTARYAYFAIGGRIIAKEFWGSYSTYEFAKKGGHKGRRLLKCDLIEVEAVEPFYGDPVIKEKSKEVRIFKGPEFDYFDEADINLFSGSSFKVGLDSNRMGYRLEGERLKGTKTGNIISSGVIPGTIQVPASGSPIVLMADSPCTGGYPRIAILHPEDRGVLAQKLPYEEIKFVWCDL